MRTIILMYVLWARCEVFFTAMTKKPPTDSMVLFQKFTDAKTRISRAFLAKVPQVLPFSTNVTSPSGPLNKCNIPNAKRGQAGMTIQN